MIDLAPLIPALQERIRLRTHCISIENKLLLKMTIDEVNALTRFLDNDKPLWEFAIDKSPVKDYLVKWGNLGIVTVAGRKAFRITPLGEAIRRKLFGARMGGAGTWDSGCNCKLCMDERLVYKAPEGWQEIKEP